MNCPNCGKQINDTATFCPFCGQKIEVEQNKQANPSPKELREGFKLTPAIIFAGVSLLLCFLIPRLGIVTSIVGIICGIVGMKNPDKKKWSQMGMFASVVILAVCIFRTGSSIGSSTSQTADALSNQVDRVKQEETVEKKAVDQQTVKESTTGSLDELLSLTTRAQENYTDYIDKYQIIANEASNDGTALKPEHWKSRFELTEKYKTEMEELSKQASEIQGLDSNVKNASDSYFEMRMSIYNNMMEYDNFISQFVEIHFDPPYMSDFKSVPDYYDALYSWYEANKAIIDAIEPPKTIEYEWENYKKAFELNKNIVEKEGYAVEYNDLLRHYSAQNMVERQYVLADKRFRSFNSIVKASHNFARDVSEIATKLAEEMNSYSEMDVESRRNYEFENDRDGKIQLTFEPVETIYPALYNTYDSFLTVNTGCICGTRKIVIEAEIPGFTQQYKQTFNLNSDFRSIRILPPALPGDLNLSSAKNAQLKVSIYEGDGKELIQSKSFPVTIKSINDVEWYNDEFGAATKDNILCFLTPDADAIDVLKRNAISEISNMTGGKLQMMAGYQESRYNHYVGTYLQAAGIMRALYDMGVRYDVASFSVSNSHQRVKLPTEVIEKKSGLCIETALTVASALQSTGMHAFLVFPTGHAQVAVEIWDKDYQDENGNIVHGEGHGEYYLIETTCLDSDSNNDEIYIKYAEALMKGDPDSLTNNYPIAYFSASEWDQYIQSENAYIIDCDDSRVLGLTEFTH